MLIIVSSSKNLDFKAQKLISEHTMPEFPDRSQILIEALRKLNPKQIASMMHINASLADLNFQRYASWNLPFTPENAKQAILAYKGEVYNGLRAWTFTEKDFHFAQDHFRTISGLYGIVRPLDLIQPYRLELAVKLQTSEAPDLYRFWGDLITQKLNEALRPMKRPFLINLASAEYFRAVNQKILTAPVINFEFLNNKDGVYKPIVVYIKKARGMMSRFIIRHQIEDPEDLKAFDEEGYIFNPRLSKEDHWVFTTN